MPLMSILGSHSLWEEKEEELRVCTSRQQGYTYTVPDGPLDEDSFNSRFEDLAVRSKVSKKNRFHLFNKLYGSYDSIIKIFQGISKPGPDKSRPESLIWEISLAALELGRQHGASYDQLVYLQVALNEQGPKLDNVVSNLDRWSSLQSLQDNLKKETCEKFITFHMNLIKAYGTTSFQSNQNLRSYKDFETILEEARQHFRNAETSYTQVIKMAEESEEAYSAESSDASSTPLTEFKLEFDKSQKPIGKRGSHGRVYRVKETTTQEWYACKVVKYSKRRSQIEAKEEISILKRLRHTHIVTISAYSQAETKFKIFMQPLADCDLEDFFTVCAEEDFPADKTKMILPWFACLLHALAFAHHSEVKHRDIKPANILLKGDHIYLSDFSLAKDFAGQDTSVAVDEEAKGNLKYRAPETKGNVAGHRKADVFSLGCVYSEMLTVVCGRSVESFCERRKAKHRTDLFRDTLPAVREWLQELRTESPNDEKKKVINMCKVIKCMLEEELDMRHSAHQALILVEENVELRCKHIH